MQQKLPNIIICNKQRGRWNNVLTKLKENNYTGPITLELCYREQYLNQSIDEFYKEGYNRGIKLEEIYKSIKTNRIKENVEER